MKALKEAIQDYLTLRRGLGFKLKKHSRFLEEFALFLEQAGESRITARLALQWATQPQQIRQAEWAARLSVVRGFALPAPSVTLEPAVQPLESDQGTSTASVASAQPPAPEKVNSTAPAPSVTSEPAVQRPEKAQVASPAEPGRSPHSSSAARPHLSTEEVALLLARGDSLMSRSDVSSARPFYERAFVGGSTQAALRLGASYDPAFLSQAGVRGVRGDPALAAYWYQRAGDLAVVEGTRNGAAR